MSAPVKVRLPAEQPVDDDLGLRVAGGDQPPARGRRRARTPPRRRRPARWCGSPRRRGRRRARRARGRPPRASASCGRMPAEKTTRSTSSGSPSAKTMRRPSAGLLDPLGRGAERGRARRGPRPAGAAPGRRPRRPAPASAAGRTRRRSSRAPARLQRAGRLQARAARRRRRRRCGRRRRAALIASQVVERAVDEAARPRRAGDRRHEGRRAGGQHERVVRRHDAAAARDRLRDRCRSRSTGSASRSSSAGWSKKPSPTRQSAVVAGEPASTGPTRSYAGHRLLGVDDDVPLVGEPALDGELDEAVADHAVADDDEASCGSCGAPCGDGGAALQQGRDGRRCRCRSRWWRGSRRRPRRRCGRPPRRSRAACRR